MKTLLYLLGAAVVGSACTYLVLSQRLVKPRLQPLVYLATGKDESGRKIEKDFPEACAGPVMTGDALHSDYTLFAVWISMEWHVVVARRDEAVIYERLMADDRKLLREACRAIDSDFARWLATARQRREAGLAPAERPEK
jgi:hypothetical protein